MAASQRTTDVLLDRRRSSANQAVNEASQASIAHAGHVTHVAPLGPFLPASQSTNEDHHAGRSTNELMEREQGLVDAMLLRFKNIVELAATNNGDATMEVAAAQAFQTNVETQALIRAAQDLLTLTRELKELWLFGPLRGLGEGEEDDQLNDNSKKVTEMVEALIRERAEGDQ